MQSLRRLGLCTAALALLVAMTPAHAQTVAFQLKNRNVRRHRGQSLPQVLPLSETKPALLKKMPSGLSAPLYGVMNLGPKENATPIVVVLDMPEGAECRLFVDSNGNGDLTDDPEPTWKPGRYSANQNILIHTGDTMVQIKVDGEPVDLRFSFLHYDTPDARRANLKKALIFYPDYAYSGEITLGGQTYNAMLFDDIGTADFRGRLGGGKAGVTLLVDLNSDGKFDPKNEAFDILSPFNVGSVSYEIKDMSAFGGKFRIVKSTKTAAPTDVVPVLEPGKKAPPFTAETTGKKTITFPDDYKSKLVLLSFWATWDGQGIGEMTNQAQVYNAFHAKGLEALGVSVDQEDAMDKVAAYVQKRKMNWPQIYEGKYFKSSVAKLYGVKDIPAAYLVDGDTGEILAAGKSLRGDDLSATIEKALAAKKKP